MNEIMIIFIWVAVFFAAIAFIGAVCAPSIGGENCTHPKQYIKETAVSMCVFSSRCQACKKDLGSRVVCDSWD